MDLNVVAGWGLEGMDPGVVVGWGLEEKGIDVPGRGLEGIDLDVVAGGGLEGTDTDAVAEYRLEEKGINVVVIGIIERLMQLLEEDPDEESTLLLWLLVSFDVVVARIV